ncbi:hypothetical protein S40288_10315 [Stachybotrys chartarum IBT 40288]|nr:hypothetical protein S40288_10315 [Stachybotrys chartarum IBT 40288]
MEALMNLPIGSDAYSQAYRDAMERVQKQDSDSVELAENVLSWIIHARRPLTTIELQHAIGVEVGMLTPDENNLPQVQDIMSVCAGLVTVDHESNIIRLVHYTTQRYFEQNIWFPSAHSDMMTICITYLSFNDFRSGSCPSDAEFEERLQVYPLYDYAAHNWGYHGRYGQTVCQVLMRFLEREARLEASIQGLLAEKLWNRHSNYSQQVPSRMTGLHMLAYFGVEEAMKVILQTTGKEDTKNSYGRTPLSYATENGHQVIAQLLLAIGKVDVDSKDQDGWTPLIYAAENGHKDIVQLLLATKRPTLTKVMQTVRRHSHMM